MASRKYSESSHEFRGADGRGSPAHDDRGFPGDVWCELKCRSQHEGVATAQYIREATIMRLAASRALQADARMHRELDVRLRRLERLMHLVLTSGGGTRRG